MSTLFLVEKIEDIISVEEYAIKKGLKQFYISTVAQNAPFFYDTFEDDKITKWNNNSFVKNAGYAWIVDFRVNRELIKSKILLKDLPYENSLLFYLAYRYGNEYKVYSDFLTVVTKEKNLQSIYIENDSKVYRNALNKILPLRSVHIGYYGE